MNRISLIIVILALFVSACEIEEGTAPGKGSGFIKLFGGSNMDIAYMALPTDDGGAICLGTTEMEATTTFRVKLIKTDMNGNVEWQKMYPEEDQEHSLIGRAVLPVENGYIVIGDSIKNAGNSALILFKVDLSGNEISGMRKIDSLENAQLHGVDLIQGGNGDLLALAEIEGNALYDTYLATVNSSNLTIDPDCRKFYSGGSLKAVKSLYQANNGEVTFSGTVAAFSSGNARLFRVPECTSSLISGPLLVQGSTKSYETNQVVAAGNGFAMVGTINNPATNNSDIFLAKLGPFGTVQYLKEFSTVDGIPMTNTEQGLTITATIDGGFLLAGSTETRTKGETDIIIIKTDAFGNEMWSRRFGDVNEEYASYVKQTSDDGYLIFGNTEFGGIDTMILIKTDSEGNIE